MHVCFQLPCGKESCCHPLLILLRGSAVKEENDVAQVLVIVSLEEKWETPAGEPKNVSCTDLLHINMV